VAAYATGAAPALLRAVASGRAVPIGDEAALVEALVGLLGGDPVDRQAVRAITEGHDLVDMAEAYRALYQRMLAGEVV
jgi:hypothetical protein